MVAWAVRVRRRLFDTVVKPSLSAVERAVVEDDVATLRGSAEVAGSRAAAVVAIVLGGVAVTEAETDGGMKRRAVLQGRKPPHEALRDDELKLNNDPLPGDKTRGRFGIVLVGSIGCECGKCGKSLHLHHNGIWLRKKMASAPHPTTDF